MAGNDEQNLGPESHVIDNDVSTEVDDDPEVTLSVTHQVRRGREGDFEE